MKLEYYVLCISFGMFFTGCSKPQKPRPLPMNSISDLENAMGKISQSMEDFQRNRDLTKSNVPHEMQKQTWSKVGYDYELSIAQCMIYDFVRKDMRLNMFCYQLRRGAGLDHYDGIQKARDEGAITDNLYRLSRAYLLNEEDDQTLENAKLLTFS